MSGDLRNGVSDPENDRIHHTGDVQTGLKRCCGGGARDRREHRREELDTKEHELVTDKRPLSD